MQFLMGEISRDIYIEGGSDGGAITVCAQKLKYWILSGKFNGFQITRRQSKLESEKSAMTQSSETFDSGSSR